MLILKPVRDIASTDIFNAFEHDTASVITLGSSRNEVTDRGICFFGANSKNTVQK